jgi:hypothetical protein
LSVSPCHSCAMVPSSLVAIVDAIGSAARASPVPADPGRRD